MKYDIYQTAIEKPVLNSLKNEKFSLYLPIIAHKAIIFRIIISNH